MDGGETWIYVENGISSIWRPSNIVILKHNPNVVFVQATGNEWYRSSDCGNSWTEIQHIGTQVIDFSENTENLYCISSFCIFISDDLGITWNQYPLTYFNGDFFPLSFITLDDSTFITAGVSYDDPWGENSVFITYDQGASWSNINFGFRFGLPSELLMIDDTIFLNVARSVTETEGGVFRLDLTNNSWHKIGEGLMKEVIGISIDSYDNKIYLASLHEGIFSVDIDSGQTNNYVPSDIFKTTISDFKFNSVYPNYLYQNVSYLHISEDYGNSWTRIDSVYNILDAKQSPYDPNKFIVSRARHGIMISEDNAQSWFTSNDGIEEQDRIIIYSVDFLNENTILISGFVPYPGEYKVSFIYRSCDGGLSWEKVLEANTNAGEGVVAIQSVYNVDDVLYAAFYTNGIWKSEDFGLTWNPLFSLDNTSFYEMEYDQQNSIFYTRTANDNEVPGRTEIYKSIDGISWISCSESFDEQYWITDLTINNNQPNELFCSVYNRDNPSLTAPHFIYSLDCGNSWNEVYFNELDSGNYIICSEIDANNNEIIFSLAESSLLKENLNFTSIKTDIINQSSMNLSNYPNPFNPSTTISFDLTAKDAKSAKVEIYNIKGQKIKTLDCCNSFAAASGSCRTHSQTVVWDGTDSNNKPVSSGVYFYKLKAGDFEKTRKMLLMK